MKKRYLFIPLVLFLLVVAVFLVQLIKNQGGERPTDLVSPLIGKPMPVFKMEALEPSQGDFKRTDLINGKPFLLTVWGTWCPSCEEEHYFLNQLASKGIRIVGLNTKDKREDAFRWLSTKKNPFDINLFDEKGGTWINLGVYGAPETFLIDGDGIVRHRLAGPLSQTTWDNVIAPLWKQYGGKSI